MTFNPLQHFEFGKSVDPSSILIFKINTSLGTGSSFTIPVNNFYDYNYNVIDWGDGSSDFGLTGDTSHTYITDGIYEIKITGVFPSFYFNNTGDKLKIISIDQWGCYNGYYQTKAFYGCVNLEINANDVDWTYNIIKMEYMFANTNNPFIENFDVSNVLEMGLLFWYSSRINQNLSLWNFNKNVIFVNYGWMDARNMSAENMDALLIKIESCVVGTGRTQTNKGIGIYGGKRTTESDAAYNSLVADGWNFTYSFTIV